MIQALFRKDLRLTAPVLAAAVFLSFATFLSVFALMKTMAAGPFPWAQAITASVHYSQWLLVLSFALLGGNAFACEREDASYLFLRALPVRVRDVLFSKIFVTLFTFEVLWLVSAAAMHATAPHAQVGYRNMLPGTADMAAIAALSGMVLGLSWLWSVVMSRPLGAAVCGLASSGLLCLVSFIAMRFVDPVEWRLPSGALPILASTVGVLGFAAGSGLFLRQQSIPQGTPKVTRMVGQGTADPLGGEFVGGEGSRQLTVLAWKDWRLLREALLGGVALVAMPYVYAALISFMHDGAAASFARASTQSLWVCCGVFAVWGGYLAAVEERSGTERFLLALPVRRLHATGSKLFVAGLPCLLILGINVGLAWIAHQAAFLPSPVDEPGTRFAAMTWSLLIWQHASLMFALPVVGAPAACFGVGWLVSARFNKPFLGIAAGAASTGVTVLMWIIFKLSVQETMQPLDAAWVFAGTSCLLAVGCVLWGCHLLAKRESE